MARKPRVHFPAALCHVIVGGKQRQSIFWTKRILGLTCLISWNTKKYSFHLYKKKYLITVAPYSRNYKMEQDKSRLKIMPLLSIPLSHILSLSSFKFHPRCQGNFDLAWPWTMGQGGQTGKKNDQGIRKGKSLERRRPDAHA